MKSKMILAAVAMAALGVANAAEGEQAKTPVTPHSHVAEKGGYVAPAKAKPASKMGESDAANANKVKKEKKVAKHSHPVEKGVYAPSPEESK